MTKTFYKSLLKFLQISVTLSALNIAAQEISFFKQTSHRGSDFVGGRPVKSTPRNENQIIAHRDFGNHQSKTFAHLTLNAITLNATANFFRYGKAHL